MLHTVDHATSIGSKTLEIILACSDAKKVIACATSSYNRVKCLGCRSIHTFASTFGDQTLRDYKNYRSQSRFENGLGSFKGLKNRIWFTNGRSSTSKGDHLTLNGSEAGQAASFPSVPDYDFKVSAGGPREPGWTPLGMADHATAETQLQDLRGIQVHREIQVSQS